MIGGVGANWHPVKKAAPDVMKERREDMVRTLEPRHQKSNAESLLLWFYPHDVGTVFAEVGFGDSTDILV